MKKLFTKTLLLLIVSTLFCSNNMSADGNDGPNVLPIILEPATSGDDLNKPKAPSRVRINAYYDGSSIVISSTVCVAADIVIADSSTGECHFSGSVMLAPEFCCPVAAVTASALTITVTVGSNVYEGVLII